LDKTQLEDAEMVADAAAPKAPVKSVHAPQKRPVRDSAPVRDSGVIIIRGTNVHSSESAT